MKHSQQIAAGYRTKWGKTVNCAAAVDDGQALRKKQEPENVKAGDWGRRRLTGDLIEWSVAVRPTGRLLETGAWGLGFQNRYFLPTGHLQQ